MHQASEDMQRCTLGLYDDDTGPFPLSNVQVRLVLSFAAQSAVQHLQARLMVTCHAYVHGPHRVGLLTLLSHAWVPTHFRCWSRAIRIL